MFVLPIILLAFSAKVFAQNTCGQQDPIPSEGDVIGGELTDLGEFPWVAALAYKHRDSQTGAGIHCGGVVIHNKYVLTAATCLNLKKLDLDEVWLGVQKFSEVTGEDVDKARKFKVAEKIQHKNFDPTTLVSNIALLKLDKEFTYSRYIRPICLPEQNEALPESRTKLVVSGWGFSTPNGSRSDHKLKLNVPMISHAECLDKIGVSVTQEQLCAEGESGKGTCYGDEGGPLMQHRVAGTGKLWYLVGIASGVSDEDCAQHGVPVVYTRVASFADWITKTTARA